jgi:pilus assembly protein CpaB
MNRRLLSILLFALVVSGGASYLVYRLAGNRMNSGSQAPTTRVVMASRNLDIGVLIQHADVKMGEWVGPLPNGTAVKKEAVVGRGVISALYEGEPVRENRLAPLGSGGGLAATIPQGMRACAVKVNEVVGVAGFVIPGMRVDVLITGNPPGSVTNAGPKVKTLLQNIQVLSAGTNFQKDNEGKPVQVQVVNLLVTPEQAEVLSLASNEMHIQLILRNPLDTLVAKTSGTMMSNLFAESGAPVPVKSDRPRSVAPKRVPPLPPPAEKFVAPRIYLIEVLNGPKRTETKFGETEENK